MWNHLNQSHQCTSFHLLISQINLALHNAHELFEDVIQVQFEFAYDFPRAFCTKPSFRRRSN